MLPENPNIFPLHNLPQPDYGEFVGREEELTQIFKLLRPHPFSRHHLVVIDGIGGIGKSTLALEVAHRCLQASIQSSTQPENDADQLVVLRQTVIERFNEEELKTLCFDLALDYDMLPGDGKGGKARELVAYMKRRDRLGELIEIIQRYRPNVSLDFTSEKSPQEAVAGEKFEAIIWTSAKSNILTTKGVAPRHQVIKVLDDIYATIAIALQREDITRARPEARDEVVRHALTRQRTLLIVDNLETVDDENVLAFLRELPAPTKAIVTTRHRIDVAYAIRLMGMSWENALQLITLETGKKGVSLQEKQARQLYERTGGVPLALVWSIGLMEWGYNSEEILTRLGQPTSDIARFTFENAIEPTLERPAFKVLLALSLFPDGATRETIGQLTELSILDRDDGFMELQRLSLISRQGDKFDVLPMTKIYLHNDSTHQATLAAMQKAFVFYYGAFIKEHVGLEDYWQPKESWRNFGPILAELNNLITTVSLAAEIGQWRIVRDIAVGIVHSLWRRGLWEQRIQVLEIALKAAKHLNELEDAAWFHVNGLGLLFAKQGEIEKALLEINKGRALANQIGNTDVLIFADLALAGILLEQGDGEAAEKKLLALLPQRMSPVIKAQLLNDLSYLYEQQGDYEAVKNYAQQGIEVCYEIEDYNEAAMGYVRLAQAHLLLDEYADAQNMLEKATEANETSPSSVVRADIFYNLGLVAFKQGQAEMARMYLEKAQYARLLREKEEVKALYDQRQTWLQETLRSVNEPYLRLALVFTGN